MVISNTGAVLGKSRKNHIPRIGDFNEVPSISMKRFHFTSLMSSVLFLSWEHRHSLEIVRTVVQYLMRIKLDVSSSMSFFMHPILFYNCSLDKINIIIKYHKILSNDITLSYNEIKRENKLNLSSISGGSRISQTGVGAATPSLEWKPIIWQDFCWKLNDNERN